MPLSLNIAQLVATQLPVGFAVDATFLANSIKIKQSLLYVAANVSSGDEFDQTKWPDNWNILISYLITYDILSGAIFNGIVTNSGISTDGTVNGGQIQEITTGPSQVKWQDTSAAFSSLVKNLTTDKNSIFNVLMSNACAMSRILGIKLPFCKGLQVGGMFIKSNRCLNYTEYIALIYSSEVIMPIVSNGLYIGLGQI